MRAVSFWVSVVCCGGLVACGDSTGEQALYGAGAGYLGAAVLDTNVVGGAAAGAAANILYCDLNPGKCN